MHRSKRAAFAVLAATAALAVLVGAAFSSPATADATIDPLQQAQVTRANCQVLLAHATSSAQATRARQCIADQTVIINALTASPSPSGSPSTGPTPSSSPSTGPTATPTTPVPTTSAPTPTPTPSPTSSGWPDATTTGAPAGTLLTPHGDVVVTVAGTVIDGWDMGSLDIRAANVTVRNSRVRCDADACLHSYSSGLRVSRVDIGPDSGYSAGIAIMDGADANASPTRNVYSGLNIHNTSDGVRCDGGFTLQDSWIHNLAMGTGAHSDGCQTTNTGNMVFRHNVIEGGNTSAFLIQSNPTNVVIDHNLLTCVSRNGEQTSYIINVGASVPQGGVVFSNNTLAGSCQAGWDGSSTNYHWSTSLWFGNVDTAGNVVGVP